MLHQSHNVESHPGEQFSVVNSYRNPNSTCIMLCTSIEDKILIACWTLFSPSCRRDLWLTWVMALRAKSAAFHFGSELSGSDSVSLSYMRKSRSRSAWFPSDLRCYILVTIILNSSNILQKSGNGCRAFQRFMIFGKDRFKSFVRLISLPRSGYRQN